MNHRHLQEAKALQSKGIHRLKAIDVAELRPTDVLRYCLQGAHLERTILGDSSPAGDDAVSTDPSGTPVSFSFEDAVRADQELEQWQHEHLPSPTNPSLPHGDPQVP